MNKEFWNNLAKKNSGSFLQSYQWGDFQESLGREIWRINLNNQLLALIIKHNLPFGKSYLYCPRGPVINQQLRVIDFREIKSLFLKQAGDIAREEKSIFLKIEPDNNWQLAIFNWQSNYNFQFSKKTIQPARTIILDISQTDDKLLEQMHHKTRYNIRLAARADFLFQEKNGLEDFEDFWRLLNQTAQRDKFRLCPKNYYQTMIEILSRDNFMKLLQIKHNNKIIAAGLFVFFNQTAVYLHGASDYNFRQMMAPYCLHWQAIKLAKAKGFRYYDFWGIDEAKWPGVTRFKKGFNGKEIIYPAAYDLIFKPMWHRAYNAVKKIRI